MKLQLRYDPVEDRAVIWLADEGASRAFWLTRRQVIALALACERPADRPEETAPRGKKADPGGRADRKLPDVASPARLGLRRVSRGLRLTLGVPGEAATSILLQPGRQAELFRALTRLAARAQWDLDPSSARFEAARVLQRVSRIR